MSLKTIPITLELRPGAEPIAGWLRSDDELPRAFRGWLELSSLLLSAAQATQGGDAAASTE